MEPVDIMQEVQINKEEALFQNKPADQLVMENQQEQLQQAATLEMQRKESILDQFSKKIPSHSLELERKLQAGPPPELGKFQKIRWNSDMKQKIQAEKRQEEEHGGAAIQGSKDQVPDVVLLLPGVFFGDGQQLIAGQQFVHGHPEKPGHGFQRVDIGISSAGFPF